MFSLLSKALPEVEFMEKYCVENIENWKIEKEKEDKK